MLTIILINKDVFSSDAQSCPTLCNPMGHSTPGFPVHHQLPESTQTHVHWVGDAIQPSHPLSSPSPPTLCLFQHQGVFKWVSSSHQVAKVLEFQLQHQSFKWIIRILLLLSRLVMSSCLHPHELQHARLLRPSLFPGVCSNSHPLSQWCHPTMWSSVNPFSCLQSCPASGSFPVSCLFPSGGQSTGASASVLPKSIRGSLPIGLTCSPRHFQESSPTPQFKSINSSALSLPYAPTLTSIHDYWENHNFDYMDVCWKINVYAF